MKMCNAFNLFICINLYATESDPNSHSFIPILSYAYIDIIVWKNLSFISHHLQNFSVPMEGLPQ